MYILLFLFVFSQHYIKLGVKTFWGKTVRAKKIEGKILRANTLWAKPIMGK